MVDTPQNPTQNNSQVSDKPQPDTAVSMQTQAPEANNHAGETKPVATKDQANDLSAAEDNSTTKERRSHSQNRSRSRDFRNGQPSRNKPASREEGEGNFKRSKGRRPNNKQDQEAALAKVVLEDIPPVIMEELRSKSLDELMSVAKGLDLKLESAPSVQKYVDLIVRHHATEARPVEAEGIFEKTGDFGFIRQLKYSFRPSQDDILVPSQSIRKFGLRTGDEITGILRAMRGNEKHCVIRNITHINKESVEGENLIYNEPFDSLTPLFPQDRVQLETGHGSSEDITGRIIDIVSPIGKGQRGLIVSPPKAGKTIVLQSIAQSIERNCPECELYVLLIDERPEEVTEMRRSVRAHVIASTFDEPATRHVQVTEILNGIARKKVEQGKDVVILLDSITRLARAYNTTQPSSGKILTGGVDANALERPKRFFGGARNIEGGGSLTIIATALVDTGSKMDEVIYEEFKGTGNMELHLERKIAEKRIFPAINLRRSSTRREEMLLKEEELHKMIILRRLLHSMEDLQAMEFLLEHFKETKTNVEFFQSMQRS